MSVTNYILFRNCLEKYFLQIEVDTRDILQSFMGETFDGKNSILQAKHLMGELNGIFSVLPISFFKVLTRSF